ncbi:MAG: hypothetical protein KGL74_01125, partial [Elusimicrobia bacterium]|nr:hypothetical protein [Elusimicrobiota bacterium]
MAYGLAGCFGGAVRTPAAPETASAAAFKRCAPYSDFSAALAAGTKSDDQLVKDAACLCSLASGFLVKFPGDSIQPYGAIKSCPAGSIARPLSP